jgi:hypothetical protein
MTEGTGAKLALIGVALTTSAAGCGESAPPAATSVTVPIHVTNERFVVDVRIGDAPPIQALLDTGSAGLRVMQGALPASAYSLTDQRVGYGYGGDLVIFGPVALAPVAIGAVGTGAPIPIMIIDESGCIPNTGCDPSQTVADHFSGLPAILGVGMRTTPGDKGVGNPIAQFPGHPPFVVHVPAITSQGITAAAGTLRIGAEPGDAFEFTTYPLAGLSNGAPLLDGTPAWNDIGPPGCVNIESTNESFCYPSLWDTGAPFSYVISPAQPAAQIRQLPLGTDVRVTLGPTSRPQKSYDVLVGAQPSPGIDLITIDPGYSTYISPGIALFYRFDALFDQEHGVVGLADNGPAGTLQ